MVSTIASINSYPSVTAYAYSSDKNENSDDPANKTDGTKDETQKAEENEKAKTGKNEELSPEEKKIVEELKKRDAEVKDHEKAHIAAGGQYTSGAASFEYQTGPDGVKYAIGGEVQIDASKIPNDPEATIRKMQTVKKAALAPVKPSSTDRAVAASASMKEMEARMEIQEAALEEQKKTGKNASSKTAYIKETQTDTKGQALDIMT